MENKKEKIKLSKNRIFQISLVISGLLVAFTFYNTNNIQSNITSISSYETRIDREKREIEDAKLEIKEIEKEFENAEVSHPLDMDGRIPLIVRDIKRLMASHNINANLNPANKTGRGLASFKLDSETGLKTITFNTEITYERYSDVKEVLVELRDSFPLTIDKLIFNSSGSVLTFTLYGN